MVLHLRINHIAFFYVRYPSVDDVCQRCDEQASEQNHSCECEQEYKELHAEPAAGGL